MITAEYFNGLCHQDKYDIVWHMATYLGVDSDPSSPTFLYQLNNFYIKVFYNCTLTTIINISSFTDAADLTPYLKKIDLKEIYNLAEANSSSAIS